MQMLTGLMMDVMQPFHKISHVISRRLLLRWGSPKHHVVGVVWSHGWMLRGPAGQGVALCPNLSDASKCSSAILTYCSAMLPHCRFRWVGRVLHTQRHCNTFCRSCDLKFWSWSLMFPWDPTVAKEVAHHNISHHQDLAIDGQLVK
jgi:hypothetical protein